jgi:uncharacterized protein
MLSKLPENRRELLHIIASSSRLRPLLNRVQANQDGDSAHDLAHLLRVALCTCRILGDIARMEEAIAAALLHDLVNIPKNHPNRAKASEFSAAEAAPLLKDAGFDHREIDEICLAIRQHSFSRGERPTQALAMSLQDADRLEALGALGIMRCFSTGVRMGTAYFDPIDPWAKSRALDDSRFSLDHFFTKLFKLPETMNTAAGREEAGLRLRPMQAFMDSLQRELGESQA